MNLDWLAELFNHVPRSWQPGLLLAADPLTIEDAPGPIDQIAGQRDDDQIVVSTEGGDGGDSAHRTGVLAFCGSSLDAGLLPLFEKSPGRAVRHPKQGPPAFNDRWWNDPDNFTRDQLVAYAAGCWRTGNTEIVQRLLTKVVERGFRAQNIHKDAPEVPSPDGPDIIAPHVLMYLCVCAGLPFANMDPFGQAILQLDIEYTQTEPIGYEINQLVLQAIVCGRLDHFVLFVPNYRERLNYYWAVRRPMPQVADLLCAVIDIELKRYPILGFSFPAFPTHQVQTALAIIQDSYDALTHINWWRGDAARKVPAHITSWFKACLADKINTDVDIINKGIQMLQSPGKLLFPLPFGAYGPDSPLAVLLPRIPGIPLIPAVQPDDIDASKWLPKFDVPKVELPNLPIPSLDKLF